jgi:hypothetical protein
MKTELNVPIIETRGRHPGEEHMALRHMRVGSSFVSRKRRETLYQIARVAGIKVQILQEGDGLWRVWKRSERPTGNIQTMLRLPRKAADKLTLLAKEGRCAKSTVVARLIMATQTKAGPTREQHADQFN